jgi:hypothetical protein
VAGDVVDYDYTRDEETIMQSLTPNNSPEPPPIALSVPPSRLTVWAARLCFCRYATLHDYEKSTVYSSLGAFISIRCLFDMGFDVLILGTA